MKKVRHQIRLLADAEGFTLNEAARLLSAKLGEEPQLIARAFWRDLLAGVFDPPTSPTAVPNDQLIDSNFLETEEPNYRYACSVMSPDRLTFEDITSQSIHALFGNEMQVGEPGDFGDRVFVPRQVLRRFCDRRDIAYPAFLQAPRVRAASSNLETEIYDVFTKMDRACVYHVDDLVKAVSILGNGITRSTQAFQRAYGLAKKNGLLNMARPGRPRKSELPP